MSSNKFSGGIYIEGQIPVRESGEIIIHGTSLTFSNENREVHLSIADINIRFGGTAKRIAYLSESAQSTTTLHTTDFDLLRHDAFQSHASALGVIKERKNHHSLLIYTFFALALAILVPSYFVFIERTIVAGMVAKKVPLEIEEALGNHLFNLQFKNKKTFIDDEEIINDLDDLIAPLLSVAHNSGYNFQVHLMEDKASNAFALPGGHIVILTGLIEESDQPEELLGVLAHEIAHVTERHSLKQAISELSGYLLFNIITSGAGDLVFAVGDNARSLLSKDYSRTQEQEADEIGFDYLVKAGISPQGLIKFFEKSSQENGIFDSKLVSMMSTHPTSDKRIKNMNTIISEYGGAFDPVNFPYAAFKDKISAFVDSKNMEPPR